MTPTNNERRTSPRLRYESFAEQMQGETGVVYRQMTDVAAGGLFLVDRLGTTDAEMRIRFPAPDGITFEVDAEVVRRTEAGVGVRFRNLSPSEQARLRRLFGGPGRSS